MVHHFPHIHKRPQWVVWTWICRVSSTEPYQYPPSFVNSKTVYRYFSFSPSSHIHHCPTTNASESAIWHHTKSDPNYLGIHRDPKSPLSLCCIWLLCPSTSHTANNTNKKKLDMKSGTVVCVLAWRQPQRASMVMVVFLSKEQHRFLEERETEGTISLSRPCMTYFTTYAAEAVTIQMALNTIQET